MHFCMDEARAIVAFIAAIPVIGLAFRWTWFKARCLFRKQHTHALTAAKPHEHDHRT